MRLQLTINCFRSCIHTKEIYIWYTVMIQSQRMNICLKNVNLPSIVLMYMHVNVHQNIPPSFWSVFHLFSNGHWCVSQHKEENIIFLAHQQETFFINILNHFIWFWWFYNLHLACETRSNINIWKQSHDHNWSSFQKAIKLYAHHPGFTSDQWFWMIVHNLRLNVCELRGGWRMVFLDKCLWLLVCPTAIVL